MTTEQFADFTQSDKVTTQPDNGSTFYSDVYNYAAPNAILVTVHRYVLGIVPWIALFLNSLSFAVFVYKLYKGKGEQNVSILLAALAVSDILSTVTAMDYGIFMWSDWKLSLMQHTEVGCRGIQYINSIARDCSSYFILIFTVDRYISVRFPLQKAIWVTRQRVLKVMATILLVSLVVEAYVPYSLQYNGVGCAQNRITILAIGTVLGRCTYGFMLPGITVAVLNCLIVRTLATWNKQRATMAGTEVNHNRRLTIILIFISSYSALFTLPHIAYWYYYSYKVLSDISSYPDEWVFASDALDLMNYTCNLFFYCLSGSQFREDMLHMFGQVFTCCKFRSVSFSLLFSCSF